MAGNKRAESKLSSKELNGQFSEILDFSGECSACVAPGTRGGLQLTMACVITTLPAQSPVTTVEPSGDNATSHAF